MTTPDLLGLRSMSALAQEWIVAVTIASEVPPRETKSINSPETFTTAMIPLALDAVADVVAGRVAHPSFPKTPIEVVLQPKAFSGTMRGLNAKATGHRDFWLEALAGKWFPEHVAKAHAAWRARRGMPSQNGPLYYYSPVSMPIVGTVPSWAATLTPISVAGIAQDYFRFFR